MTNLPALSQRIIREKASANAYSRGEAYYQQGAVTSVFQRDMSLYAEVEGSQFEPYNIKIDFNAQGLTAAHCDCPVEDSYCKHSVAVLLYYVEGNDIVERSSAKTLIQKLLKKELVESLLHLTAEHPEIVDSLEKFLQTPSDSLEKTQRKTKVDVSIYSRLMKQAVRNCDYDWDGNAETEGISDVLDMVDSFLEGEDFDNALSILEAMTTALFDTLEDDEYEAIYYDESLFAYLDECWAEMLLSIELSPESKEYYRQSLYEWAKPIEYGNLDIAITALEQGWDDPGLLEVFKGKITSKGMWRDAEIPYFADDLARVRLRILERQGRFQDYVYLAEAEGRSQDYLSMLVKMGRVDDALAEREMYILTSNDALSLAKSLAENGAVREALEISDYGLNLKSDSERTYYGSHKYELAIWTIELATSLNDKPRALNANIIAFNERPSFADYEALEVLAEDGWDSLKPQLLKTLRSTDSYSGIQEKVNIFLKEDLFDDAIKSVDKQGSYDSEPVQQVLRAVTHSHPDWVIGNACRRAESIMDGGKAQYYNYAHDWLGFAKAAYESKQDARQWHIYLQELKRKHGRKYKLMGYLNRL